MSRTSNTRFAVAVHVLTYLAGTRERSVSSDELSGSTNTNPVYVRRVLGPLREAGLVRSRSGPSGGWEIADDPDDMTLGTIWRTLEGEHPVLGLHGPDPSCPIGRRVQESLQAIDRRVAETLADDLDHVTINDVLAGRLPNETGSRR